MSLNESTVEDAALTWFGELGYDRQHKHDHEHQQDEEEDERRLRRCRPCCATFIFDISPQ